VSAISPMPSYGSLHSPSLRKMNGQMEGTSRRRTSGMGSINMDNIIGDPFALATISIALVSLDYVERHAAFVFKSASANWSPKQFAWIIAFISSIVSQVQGPFPNYSWWAIVYMLFCILGVFVVIASDTTQTYHVAIVGFLSTGLVLTSSSVNSFVYASEPAREAAAAGHILLSMVTVGSSFGSA
jgi:SHO1 osmosensor